MSEDGDYRPDTRWSGHDFGQAKATYDQNAGRGYGQARAAGLIATDAKLVPDSIETNASGGMCIDTDFTGSMQGSDKGFFVKAPYFLHEVQNEYLGKGAEISFGGFCDINDAPQRYPLQIRPFAEGPKMNEELDALLHCSGGSGPESLCEAHGLAMLYRIHNTHMPKLLNKPPYIIITDEMPGSRVTLEDALAYAKVKLKKAIPIEEIVEQLSERYSFYLVQKPYDSERMEGDKLPEYTQQIYNRWKGLIGAERIALLPDINRAVDVIFGLLAQETGRVGYFRKEIEGRQSKAQVATVYKSLKTVHALPKPATATIDSKKSGASSTKGLGGGKKTDEW